MGDSEPFSDKAITLAYEPHNVGELKDADCQAHCRGECGDSMTIYLKIAENIISDITFLTDGCGATLACGSAVTDLARGKTPLQASHISPQHIIRELDGLPSSHLHCAVLAAQCLKKAIQDGEHTPCKKD